jgi:hypothetical protein
MLYESTVINTVCEFLKEQNFVIEQQLSETQKGDDIIAVASDNSYRLYIEAKGETSSKEKSNKFGTPFDKKQVKNHVAVAFFRAVQMMKRRETLPVYVGIALPKNINHECMISHIEHALKVLNIEVFWVNSDKEIEIAGFSSVFQK